MNILSFQITQGDARDLIMAVPDHSVDLILTDPPYNLAPYSTGNIKMRWRKDINNDLAAWDSAAFDPQEWAREFCRVLKPAGNLFAFTSYNLLGRWHEVFDPLFDTFQFMVWHKTKPVPKIFKAGFLNSCELIVCAWNKQHTWNFISQKDMHNFIKTPICMRPERLHHPVHPTQKPVAVLQKIIRIASDEHGVVLDPFMGVGSTGVAALRTQREFIGFELEEQYFQAAQSRLEHEAHQHQLALPDAPPRKMSTDDKPTMRSLFDEPLRACGDAHQ